MKHPGCSSQVNPAIYRGEETRIWSQTRQHTFTLCAESDYVKIWHDRLTIMTRFCWIELWRLWECLLLVSASNYAAVLLVTSFVWLWAGVQKLWCAAEPPTPTTPATPPLPPIPDWWVGVRDASTLSRILGLLEEEEEEEEERRRRRRRETTQQQQHNYMWNKLLSIIKEERRKERKKKSAMQTRTSHQNSFGSVKS